MHISRGDLIISSKPFAFVLIQSQMNSRCDQCFKLLKAKISCYKCLKVMYCSRKCQIESKESGNHSHECPVLATRPVSCMARLIARVIQKLETNGTYNECQTIGPYSRDWDCLMDHYENITKDFAVMRDFEFIYNDLALIFGDSLPDIKIILSIYGKLLINSFAVQDPLMKQIGKAIYLGPSILDHSCKPTASFLFIGTTLYIKALKTMTIQDIKDLRISYIDEFETTVERQRQLKSAYYFDCDCQRCTFDESIVDMSEDKSLRLVCEQMDKLSIDSNYLIDIACSLHNNNSFSQQKYGLCANSVAQNDDNLVRELAADLRRDVMPLRSVLEVKIAEFVAIHDQNVDLWLNIMAIFRSYYGDCHHRLALKLYLLAINVDHKYPALKRQLLTEAKSIAIQITPDIGKQMRDTMGRSSRPIHQYSKLNTISDSIFNSTLLYLIETEMISNKSYAYYTTTTTPKPHLTVPYKPRSRSSVTHNRNIRYRLFI